MLKPLNNIKNLADPLKMFQATWAMSFQGNLATFIKNNTNAKIDASEVGKDLELRCQSYSFPKITGDKTEVNLGGFKRVYAGKQVREGEWSVQFVEVWDSSITDVFKAWFNSYHNYLNGKINLLSDYTATVTVKLVNPEESYDSTSIAAKKQSYDIILYDVFPLEINFPKIDASKSDPVTIDAKFHYNYFLMGDEIAASQQAPSDN